MCPSPNGLDRGTTSVSLNSSLDSHQTTISTRQNRIFTHNNVFTFWYVGQVINPNIHPTLGNPANVCRLLRMLLSYQISLQRGTNIFVRFVSRYVTTTSRDLSKYNIALISLCTDLVIRKAQLKEMSLEIDTDHWRVKFTCHTQSDDH